LLAGGSVSTGVEAIGMVSQKMSAPLEVQRAAAIAAKTGNAALSPARSIAIYRPKIHANRRRLRLQKHQPWGSPVALLKAPRRDRSVQRVCFGS
jgi:hypothetical protein